MEPIIIPLPENLANTLQYLYYITQSYETIVKEVLSNKRGLNANKELLDYYNSQYIDYNLQLKTLQEEVINEYGNIPNGASAKYHIDFVKQKLIIESIINPMEKNI